ncbi:MAG: ATP synthase F1 subunit delta [Eubacteriales bacterium]|nr:ATP synthase F1 subunit delta [Eubacteriales bacterium]
MAKLVSQVYGEALFDLGVEAGLLDALSGELDGVCGIFRENPDFGTLLRDPELDKDEKKSVFDRVFEGRISRELTGFLHLLLEKDRFGELFSVRDDFEKRRLAFHKIGVVHVTSAQALSEEQKEKLRQRLLATTAFEELQIHYREEEALIGGLQIRIGDRVVDSSIRSSLARMKESLMRVSLTEKA